MEETTSAPSEGSACESVRKGSHAHSPYVLSSAARRTPFVPLIKTFTFSAIVDASVNEMACDGG